MGRFVNFKLDADPSSKSSWIRNDLCSLAQHNNHLLVELGQYGCRLTNLIISLWDQPDYFFLFWRHPIREKIFGRLKYELQLLHCSKIIYIQFVIIYTAVLYTIFLRLCWVCILNSGKCYHIGAFYIHTFYVPVVKLTTFIIVSFCSLLISLDVGKHIHETYNKIQA